MPDKAPITIRNVQEIPPRPTSAPALIPLTEASEGPWSREEAGEDVFPVTVIDSVSPEGEPSAGSIGASLATVYPDKSAYGLAEASVVDLLHVSGGEVHLVLEGPGSIATVLGMDRGAAEDITPETILLQSENLGPTGFRQLVRRTKVEFVEDPDQQPWQGKLWLPILRVHRPDWKGCKAEYTVASGKSRSHSAAYKFLGVGGGGDVRFDVDFEEEIGAQAACHELAVRAEAEIVFGDTLVGGVPVSTGYRIKVHKVYPKQKQLRDVPENVHKCAADAATVPDDQQQIYRDLLAASGGAEDALHPKFSIGKTVSGKISADASYGKVPFSVSIGVERASRRATSIETTLVPGARYLGYRPTKAIGFELCWTLGAI